MTNSLINSKRGSETVANNETFYVKNINYMRESLQCKDILPFFEGCIWSIELRCNYSSGHRKKGKTPTPLTIASMPPIYIPRELRLLARSRLLSIICFLFVKTHESLVGKRKR